jgi:RNA polymerase sigma factor (sigma-70 family)
VSSVPQNSMDGRGGLRAAVSRSALRLQSDRRLVSLTRAGSDAAFAVIVERYRGPLLTYCRRMLGPDEAEDALQQTFANALAALQRDGREMDLRPWLYRISHNIAINSLRRKGRHTEPLDDQFDGVPQPPDVLDEKLRVERLVHDIEALPDRQRTAIVAHELEGRSYEEIARRMSATTPIVRQLVHRARTRLRDVCGVLVPAWALRSALFADPRAASPERVGEAVAGGAAGGAAGAGILKAGTALLATGAIATGAGGLVTHDQRRAARDRPDAARAQVVPSRDAVAPKPQTPATSRHASETPAAKTRGPAKDNPDGRHEGGKQGDSGERDHDGPQDGHPKRQQGGQDENGHDEHEHADHGDGGDREQTQKASHEDYGDQPDEHPDESGSSDTGHSGPGGSSEGDQEPAESGGGPGPSPDPPAEP